MVRHKSKTVIIASISATRATTLCGRMNKRSWDGMNIADHDDEVTCKFCLKMMDGVS